MVVLPSLFCSHAARHSYNAMVCCLRACVQPNGDVKNLPDRLWRGLNAYNYYPMLTKDVPRHSLCDTCDTCHQKYIGGEEGSMHSMGKVNCLRCGGGPY